MSISYDFEVVASHAMGMRPRQREEARGRVAVRVRVVVS